MKWIFESVTAIVLAALSALLDLFSGGMLELLAPSIGADESLFEIVFNGIIDMSQYLMVFAWALLFLIFIWQMVKIMTSPDATETPFQLIGRTVVAGIGIGASHLIVNLVQSLFGMLYAALLDAPLPDSAENVTFSGVLNFLEEGILSTIGGFNLNTMTSLVANLITIIFALVLAWAFLGFLFEVVARYVIIGVLYYTSPLAFATAGSKSTSGIFASWVKMLFSQTLLMCFSVFFYRLFMHGFNGYIVAINEIEARMGGLAEDLTGAATISASLVWCFCMYSFLYIGGKMDNYLSALGLSTAQVGMGLFNECVSAGNSAIHFIKSGASMANKAGRFVTGGSAASGASPKTANLPFGPSSGGTAGGAAAGPVPGKVMAKTLKQNAENGSSKPVRSGEAQKFVENLGAGAPFNGAKDVAVAGGALKWKTDGHDYMAVPLAGTAEQQRTMGAALERSNLGGLVRTADGTSFFVGAMTPAAAAAMSSSIDNTNAKFNKARNHYAANAPDAPGVAVRHAVDNGKQAVPLGQQMSGDIAQMEQAAASSVYAADTSMPMNRMDGDSRVYDTTADVRNGYSLGNTDAFTSPDSTAEQRADAFEKMFPNSAMLPQGLQESGIADASYDKDTGLYTVTGNDGQQYAVAPAAKYDYDKSHADNEDNITRYAANGTTAAFTPLNGSETAADAFKERDEIGRTADGVGIYRLGSMKEPLPDSVSTTVPQGDTIYQTAARMHEQKSGTDGPPKNAELPDNGQTASPVPPAGQQIPAAETSGHESVSETSPGQSTSIPEQARQEQSTKQEGSGDSGFSTAVPTGGSDGNMVVTPISDNDIVNVAAKEHDAAEITPGVSPASAAETTTKLNDQTPAPEQVPTAGSQTLPKPEEQGTGTPPAAGTAPLQPGTPGPSDAQAPGTADAADTSTAGKPPAGENVSPASSPAPGASGETTPTSGKQGQQAQQTGEDTGTPGTGGVRHTSGGSSQQEGVPAGGTGGYSPPTGASGGHARQLAETEAPAGQQLPTSNPLAAEAAARQLMQGDLGVSRNQNPPDVQTGQPQTPAAKPLQPPAPGSAQPEHTDAPQPVPGQKGSGPQSNSNPPSSSLPETAKQKRPGERAPDVTNVNPVQTTRRPPTTPPMPDGYSPLMKPVPETVQESSQRLNAVPKGWSPPPAGQQTVSGQRPPVQPSQQGTFPGQPASSKGGKGDKGNKGGSSKNNSRR